MAVISVEVPDKIAKKFQPYMVISSFELYEELDNNILIDFWSKGIGKKEFDEYLSAKNQYNG